MIQQTSLNNKYLFIIISYRSSISSKNKNSSKSFTSANGSESFRTEFVLEAKVVRILQTYSEPKL